MAGLITEEEFVELIERIPIMEQKLDRVLLALDKYAQNGDFRGFDRNEGGDMFDYSEAKAIQDGATIEQVKAKRQKANKLKLEADELERELGI